MKAKTVSYAREEKYEQRQHLKASEFMECVWKVLTDIGWNEEHLSEQQGGYREGRGCSNHIYLLKWLEREQADVTEFSQFTTQ